MATSAGAGTHTYELIQDWAKLPDGETFGVVSTVATDSQIGRASCRERV